MARATTLALERWSAATGCDLYVSDAGVTVDLVMNVTHPDGSSRGGVTSEDRMHVQINYRSNDVLASLMHELGHALGGEHVDSLGALGGTGHTDVIDAPTLASVCARLPCRAFRPEL